MKIRPLVELVSWAKTFQRAEVYELTVPGVVKKKEHGTRWEEWSL